ncbi:MAG: hypothetical protein LQ343_005879 [Gyalolechia ehrenbergii]|nr:MAG: hypothetical protein LQ343_005879 [Gyalolechia ehrenbergii]
MDISRLEKGHFEGDISHSSGDQLERRDLGTVEEHNAANASSSPLTATTNETRSKVDGLLRGLLKVVEDFGGTDETTDRGHQDEAAVVGSTDPVSQWRLPSSVRNPRDNLRNSPAAIAATQNARIMTSLSAADHVPRQGSEQHIMVEECGPNYKSCRERWSKHRHGPNVKIRVISDLAIQVSERYRREIREEWMSGCSSDELLDSWKYLWRCEGGASRGLSYWACEDAKRQELQLALIDALTSGRPAPFFLWIMDKDFRTIACWVSLIGIRLDELYRFAKTHDMVLPSHRSATISPVAQIEILIEYLWASNKSEDPVVGEILENCYRRKILVQPCFDDPPDFFSSRLILISHVYAVRVAVYLVNLLFKHDIPVLRPHEDIDKIWTTPVNQIEIGMRQNTANSHLNVGVNPFFSISDFNLRDLQRLGGLRLLWTPYWDEHLKLENDDGSYVLYIYWFHHDLSCYFSTM